MKKKLEICVFNLNDCITASKYNIDRIEFCKERSLGGISPKKDDIKKALTYHENIFPIIRPRKGNFIYNNEELGEMVDLIEHCKKIGCKGVVFGVLNSQNEIDKETCKILVGDLNIAPLENDVWSHKQLLNVVSHTPIETEALLELIKTCNWIDVMREFVPQNEKLYSWWSYRNRNWEISNRGRRLDHFWVTKNLFPQVKSGVIYKETRSWERPSDHVPIVVDIDI